jgi:hypothetical protein
MEAFPGDPATGHPFDPYFAEIRQLLAQHMDRHPLPEAMVVPWSTGMVSVLAYAVIKRGLSADEGAAYVRAVCEGIVQAAQCAVNRWHREQSSKGDKR